MANEDLAEKINFFGIASEIPYKPAIGQNIANAHKAISDYYKRSDRFMIPKYDENGNETYDKVTLKGFSFNREDLESLLSNVGNADRVMFAFAYHDGSLTNTQKGFTMIMMGINVHDTNGNYNLLLDNKMYDMCEPCPTKCTVPQLHNLP